MSCREHLLLHGGKSYILLKLINILVQFIFQQPDWTSEQLSGAEHRRVPGQAAHVQSE